MRKMRQEDKSMHEFVTNFYTVVDSFISDAEGSWAMRTIFAELLPPLRQVRDALGRMKLSIEEELG